MDLPPDKAKLLKNYDNEKKWDIICDQVSVWFIALREMIHFFWKFRLTLLCFAFRLTLLEIDRFLSIARNKALFK